MAAGLIAGMVLARLKHFRVHGWLQGSIAIANAVVIAFVMVPSFHRNVLSATSTEARIVWVHAIAGGVAELLAVCIVLSAGLGWFPRRFRITNYKLWMRSCLAVWLVAVGLGAYVYKQLNGQTAVVQPVQSSLKRVVVKNFSFDPPDLTVPIGTEVEWIDERGRHNVQADDGSFKSSTLTAGGTFRHRFDHPGVYRYFCDFHGSAGGHDMAGVVTVR
jgi:plastocyanin